MTFLPIAKHTAMTEMMISTDSLYAATLQLRCCQETPRQFNMAQPVVWPAASSQSGQVNPSAQVGRNMHRAVHTTKTSTWPTRVPCLCCAVLLLAAARVLWMSRASARACRCAPRLLCRYACLLCVCVLCVAATHPMWMILAMVCSLRSLKKDGSSNM